MVPGAWLGGWVWNKISPLMEKRGHKVHPVTLTGMGDRIHLLSGEYGVETAIQDVLNVVRFNDIDDFVLVGHSFAGKIIAAVADRIPDRVKMLLYLDASRPEKVRTPQASFDPTTEFGTLPEGSIALPFSEEVLEHIGTDIVGEDRKWMLEKSTPWPLKYATEPITLSEKFDQVRSSYIFCTDAGDPVDEIIQGKWGKIEGPYRLLEAGHWPMVSIPEETVTAMLELAAEAGH